MSQQLIVMLGAPGSGKGTQATALANALGLAHVSTGDLLRHERALRTPLGEQADSAMDRGGLVPDALITDMVMRWLASDEAIRGAVLDGFPRTLRQAVTLECAASQQAGRLLGAIYLDVPTSTLVQRLLGRLVCTTCGDTYHEAARPPIHRGQCDNCAGALEHRLDDRADVVATRIAVYQRQTQPLIAFYDGRGLLHRVDGGQAIDRVWADVLEAAGQSAYAHH